MVIELMVSVGDDVGRGVAKFDWFVGGDNDDTDDRELLIALFVATVS